MSERIALVAADADGDAARVLAILAREGFALTFFDSVCELVQWQPLVAPVAVVLWLEADELSRLADTVEPVRECMACTPIVVACASIDWRELRPVLAAGAKGVVVGNELETSLGACVQAVRAGQLCVPGARWREVEPAVQ